MMGPSTPVTQQGSSTKLIDTLPRLRAVVTGTTPHKEPCTTAHIPVPVSIPVVKACSATVSTVWQRNQHHCNHHQRNGGCNRHHQHNPAAQRDCWPAAQQHPAFT